MEKSPLFWSFKPIFIVCTICTLSSFWPRPCKNCNTSEGLGKTGTWGGRGCPQQLGGKPETETPGSSLLCRGIKVKNNTGNRANTLGICPGQLFSPLSPPEPKSNQEMLQVRVPQRHAGDANTCRVFMQERMSFSVFSHSASSAPVSARMPCRRAICRRGGSAGRARRPRGARGALGRAAPHRAAGRAGTAPSEGRLAGTIAAAAAGGQGRTWQREAQGSLSDPSRGRNAAINAPLKDRRVI